MKRKQKVPRRTRRQTSPKADENTDNLFDLSGMKENPLNSEENFKTPINDNDITEKASPLKNNKIYRKASENLNENSNPENDFGLHLKCVEKRQEESEITSENCTETSTQLSKLLSNQSEDFNMLTRNLKRPIDNLTLSADIPKTPAIFVNLKNESDGGKMPVILNVFTLSNVPASHSKQRTTNLIRKNNFPVTPPCSPPLSKLEQFTAAQNISCPTKIKIPSPLDNNLNNVIVNGPSELNVNANYRPVEHNRPSANQYAFPVFPAQIKQFMDQESYAIQDQTKRSYDVSYGHQHSLIMTNTEEKSRVIFSSRKLAPKGFVSQVFPGRNSEELRGITGEYIPPDQHVYSEFLKDMHKNHMVIYDASNNKNVALKNNENPGLNSLSGSAKNNAIVCEAVETAVTGHKTHHVQRLEKSPVTVTSTQKSDSTVQLLSDQNKFSQNDCHAALSPRDVRVLQLKKRLQEQEAALKKLRTNHS